MSAKRSCITTTSKKVWISHFFLFTKFTQNKPHHIWLPSFPLSLSLQDQDAALEKYLTVSPLYRKLRLSTVSYLEQLLCGMPYLLMFSKRVLSMLLRSFSNHILKYKPSTTLVCYMFFLFFLFFFLLSVFFLSLILFLFSSFSAFYAHTSHLRERSPTSFALLFLQSCLNICLWSLKPEVIVNLGPGVSVLVKGLKLRRRPKCISLDFQ